MLIKTASLSPEALKIIRDQATQAPFSGKFIRAQILGTYLCRQCGLALFRADNQFDSGCGWPSFDAEIPNTVNKKPDQDGRRTEIVCSRCDAHLGHIFYGEEQTPKNTRYCVNSLSLDFVHDLHVTDTQEGIFAAGCFWGVEHLFKKLDGVVLTEVGYCGGQKDNPEYEEVCFGQTGHLEAVRVVFDSKKLSYAQVAQYFFEIHDPTQINGQGPDMGEQYLSVGFYYNELQKQCLQDLISLLQIKGLKITTSLRFVSTFWAGEDYHQEYYLKTKKNPYCHSYIKRFD